MDRKILYVLLMSLIITGQSFGAAAKKTHLTYQQELTYHLFLACVGIFHTQEKLMRATEDQAASLIEQLIALGANPNHEDLEGQNCLIRAIITNKGKVVDTLLQKGACPAIAEKKFGSSLIHAARINTKKEIVEADSDSSDSDDNTDNDTPEALLTLLRYPEIKKTINAFNEDHRTPLMNATLMGQNNTVKILLEHGANPNLTDETGDTALHAAALVGKGKKRALIVQHLLEHGADPNSKNKDNLTPLNLVTIYSAKTVVPLLLAAGADPTVKGRHQITPLHRIVSYGLPHLITLLLQHGADSNARDEDGNTPLHEAARNPHKDWQHGKDGSYKQVQDTETVSLLIKHRNQ